MALPGFLVLMMASLRSWCSLGEEVLIVSMQTRAIDFTVRVFGERVQHDDGTGNHVVGKALLAVTFDAHFQFVAFFLRVLIV